TTTQDWIVGSANEKKETYIPVDIDFSINKAYNFSVNFGTGNGGYDDNGGPIINQDEMIQFEASITDWDNETTIPLPEPEPEPEEASMNFTIAVNNELGLNYMPPFDVTEESREYTLTIEWGDGETTVIDKNTVLTTQLLTHTYKTEGTYIVTISSSEEDFTKNQIPAISLYDSEEHRKKLISLNTYLLYNEYTDYLRFENCTNLTTVCRELFKHYPNKDTFKQIFYNCTNLREIPAGLFDKNTEVKSFYSAFRYCTNLREIPAGLFDKNTEVESFELTFANCTNLTKIPTGLFDKNTEVSNFRSSFYNCKKLSIVPEKLFDKNRKVPQFSSVFENCTNAIIPANLFCDESSDMTTRFNNGFSVFFNNAFRYTGTELSPENIKESKLPALWNYTFSN
ncbi:MAG: hypothetical protein ACRCZY_12425, partial [Phocaeicola sp.]